MRMPTLLRSRSLARTVFAATFAATLFASVSTVSSAQTINSVAQKFLSSHPSLHLPAQADRVQAGASMAEQARFAGHVAPFAKTGNTSGAPAADSPLSLMALLKRSPEMEAAFEDLLAKQQDPGSPLYHQWLTPTQVGALYGPTEDDVNAVVSWLNSAGFTVESVDPARTRIHFSTTFGAAAGAFKTKFANYTAGGSTLYTVTEEPSIPAALSGVLGGVAGLSEVKYYPTSRQGTFDPSVYENAASGVKPMYTGGSSTHYVAPGDFNAIYNITPVLNAGYTGTGQRIAIIGRSRVLTADISRYQTLFGLPTNVPNVVIPTNGSDPGTSGDDRGEQTLDIERVVATSPGATVDLVVSGGSSGLGTALDWNVNTLVDKIMSVSYGTCESQYTASSAASDNSYFQQAASEGITTLISSGDTGVLGCSGFTSSSTTVQNTPAINGLCGSQYVTCVGGTEFAEGSSTSYWSSSNGANYVSALGYIPEGAWNESAHPNSAGTATVYEPLGTGGGPSAFIAKPSWQTGTGVPADGKRDVPDISFTSAVYHDGYLICINTSTSCTLTSGGGIGVYGGTSAAAPGMAGITAILNQKTGNTAGYGNLNPLLYSLVTTYPSAFHDTTVASSGVSGCVATTPSLCNNSTPGSASLAGGVSGYLVTNGYDAATGLGSLDVSNFISGVTAAYSMSAAPSTLTLKAGATTGNTSVVTITASSSFSGTVALSCSVALSSGTAATPPTCAMSTPSVTLTAGASATSTMTITSSGGSTTTCSTSNVKPTLGPRSLEISLAGLLLLALPFRRRKLVRGVLTLSLFAFVTLALNGCGSGGSTGGGTTCTPVTTGGSTTGSYVVTVRGTSGTLGNTVLIPLTLTN